MGKVSKNARVNRKADEGSKDYVKVIKAIKSKKSSSYSFAEKIVHKDKVKEYLEQGE